MVSENTIEENILRKSDQKRQLDFLAIQSGGFTTDSILQQINLRDFFGNPSAAGLDADDVRAAMRSAEDEADVMAAAEAEKVRKKGGQLFVIGDAAFLCMVLLLGCRVE